MWESKIWEFNCDYTFNCCLCRNRLSNAWRRRLVSYGSCICGGVDHIVDIFECVTNIFALFKCHTLDSWGTSVTSFYCCNIFNMAYNFHISSFPLIHLMYSKVDIENYWLLKYLCVCGKCYRQIIISLFPNSMQIQKKTVFVPSL